MAAVAGTTAPFDAARHRRSRRVFVGNLPPRVTAVELAGACEEIRPVVSLRLAAGVSIGHAVVEYLDEETALSACRNLNGYSLLGRQLRVSLASGDQTADVGFNTPVGDRVAAAAAERLLAGSAGTTSAWLAGRSPKELQEFLEEMRAPRSGDAAAFASLLTAAPELARALYQAEIILGMVAPASAPARKRAADVDGAPAITPPPGKLRKR